MEVNYFQIFLLVALSSTTVYGLSQVQEEKIDAYIEDVYMKVNGVPGLILSIVEDGEVVVAKGYGYKNVKENIPADEKTLMSVGSITKGILGTLVAKVLDEKFPEKPNGALDTPIPELLPNSNIPFLDRYRSQSMTFRDLLSHRSCLSSDGMDLTFGGVNSLSEKSYRTRYEKEICSFRNGYFYNNALYGLAGELIAEIAGTPFTELLLSFLEEIGMNRASVLDREGLFEDLEHMSSGYYFKDGETRLFNPKLLTRVHSSMGAGGIIASAENMGAYMKFHLSKGKVGDVQIIPQDVLERVYTIANPAVAVAEGKNTSDSDPVHAVFGYALGYQVILYDGWLAYEHGGYWSPFESGLIMFPALKTGIFISTNGPGFSVGTGSGVVNGDLIAFIFQVLRGKTTIEKPSAVHGNPDFDVIKFPQLPLSEVRKKAKRKAAEYGDLIGQYGHPESGDLFISFEDETNQTLQMNYGDFGIGRLVLKEDLVFEIDWKTDILQHFYTFGTFMPVPSFQMDLSREESAIIVMDGVPSVIFVKDATLDTFPQIPWLPDSCVPALS